MKINQIVKRLNEEETKPVDPSQVKPGTQVMPSAGETTSKPKKIEKVGPEGATIGTGDSTETKEVVPLTKLVPVEKQQGGQPAVAVAPGNESYQENGMKIDELARIQELAGMKEGSRRDNDHKSSHRWHDDERETALRGGGHHTASDLSPEERRLRKERARLADLEAEPYSMYDGVENSDDNLEEADQTAAPAAGVPAQANLGASAKALDAAIRKFQKSAQLTVDGDIGPKTTTALNQALAGNSAATQSNFAKEVDAAANARSEYWTGGKPATAPAGVPNNAQVASTAEPVIAASFYNPNKPLSESENIARIRDQLKHIDEAPLTNLVKGAGTALMNKPASSLATQKVARAPQMIDVTSAGSHTFANPAVKQGGNALKTAGIATGAGLVGGAAGYGLGSSNSGTASAASPAVTPASELDAAIKKFQTDAGLPAGPWSPQAQAKLKAALSAGKQPAAPQPQQLAGPGSAGHEQRVASAQPAQVAAQQAEQPAQVAGQGEQDLASQQVAAQQAAQPAGQVDQTMGDKLKAMFKPQQQDVLQQMAQGSQTG